MKPKKPRVVESDEEGEEKEKFDEQFMKWKF